MAWPTVPTVGVGGFGKAADWNKIPTDLLTLSADGLEIEAGLVARGSLKTATEEQSKAFASGEESQLTFSSIADYAFNVRGYTSLAGGAIGIWYFGNPASYQETVRVNDLTSTGAFTGYVQMRYMQASPPHTLGKIPDPWGQWLYVLLDDTGKIQRSWTAEDPPFYLRYRGKYPKGHPYPQLRRPHPWVNDTLADGLQPGEIPTGWEMRLIDMRSLESEESYDPTREMLVRMKAKRNDMLAAGADASELDQWESSVMEKSQNEKPVQMRRIERLLRRQAMNGSGLLELLEKGSGFPAFDNATRCISDDVSHPDHRFLPERFMGKDAIVKVFTQP